MASGPFTEWQIEGEKWKEWQISSSWAPKITVDCGCSHEIRRRLLLGRKAMTNLDSVLKSRDMTLLTKVCIAKATVFPVVTCDCESLTIKKAERQRIDAFELWCWRRFLKVPSTPTRSNQAILREINPEYSLKGLMLKLKLQYFCHLMRTDNSLEKPPGKDQGQKEKWVSVDEVAGQHHWCNEQELG